MAADQIAGSRDVGTLLRGERQVLEMIATGAPLASVLDELCRVIDQRSKLMSAVFFLDDSGKHLTFVAGPHLPDQWRQIASAAPLPVTAAGACGTAVTRRDLVVVPDINGDPRYAVFGEAARTSGIQAAWSMPFYAKDQRVLGTFAVFSPAAGPPSELDLELIARATHLASIAVERDRTEEELRRGEGLLRLVLDALPVGVSVVDHSGDIILSNPAAKRIWGRLIGSGRKRHAESKGWWHLTGKRLAPEDWGSSRALATGEISVNDVIDIETFDGVRKTIQNSAVPIRDADQRITGAVVVLEDITGRMTAQRELDDSYKQMRTLTGRLMRAQDDERRRIAQLLHETTAQNLAALKMLLARLNRSGLELGGSDRDALTDSIALAEQSMTEVRTLSYLLHPPFLDEAGLMAALRWYAAGFAERSGIKVGLDLPESLERLPLDTETALFRVVQESLINIHRHAGSDIASIRLRRDAGTLALEIEDRGHGIPSASLNLITTGGGVAGVGIAGMSERLKQLGGRLEITSDERGTTVRAVLPLVKGAGC
jgi:PAS domain S-box-containing protein